MIVKLLEKERCKFEHIFHRSGKFHCFTCELSDRRDAIEKLKLAGTEALFCGDEGEKASEENAIEFEEASEECLREEDNANE